MISSNILLMIVSFSAAVAAIYALCSIILFQGGVSRGDELQLSTKNILEQVEVLYDKKEYALVELLAAKYLDRVPGHVDVRKFLAKAFFEDSKYNLAIKHCDIILQKRSNDLETRKLLGRCFVKKHLYNKAISEFDYVYEKDNKDKEVIKTLADLYTKTDQTYMAIDAYNELVELSDDSLEIADLQLIIAELSEEVRDYPAAFDAYKSRLSILPKDIDTNKKLTELYIKLNNFPVAIETLLLMLSFVNEPKVLSWIFEMLIDLYEQTEDYEKAISYAEKLIELPGSDKFNIRDRIAGFNLKLGKNNEGITILEELAMMTQNGFDVTVQLADAYIANSEYQKALDKYLLLLDKANQREAKQLNSLICNLYIKWAEHMISSKDYPKAMDLLERALQYNPISSEAYYSIAYSNYEQKNYNNTVEYINKALSYDKDHEHSAKYLLMMSYAQHELGNFFEEKKALADLLKLDEKNPEGLYRLGLMYIVQHDVKNAEEAFKKAILYDPESVQAKYNLALIYENSNRDRARELYIEVLEQDPTFVEAKNALTDLASSSDTF